MSKKKDIQKKPSRSLWEPLPSGSKWYKHSLTLKYLLLVLVVTAVVYQPTFKNEFVNWDDDLYVEKNPLIVEGNINDIFYLETGKTLKAALKKEERANLDKRSFVAGNYHPLTILTLAWNYKISEFDPWSYQFFNIVLHLLNTLLVFILVLKLSGRIPWIALLTAAIFGLHPLHVESVSWVAERKDVLYSFFFLLGLITYLNFQKDKKRGQYMLTLVFFILSCLAKPAAVVFPIVMLLLDWWHNPKIWMKGAFRLAPFFAIALIFGLINITSQTMAGSVGGLLKFSIVERLALAGYGFFWYILHFLVPVKQSSIYPYPKAIDAMHIMFTVFTIGVFVWAFLKRNQYRWLFFGLMFMLINLLLVLQFVTVGGAIVADRYTYIPYIGLGLALAYVVKHLMESKGKSMGWLPKVVMVLMLVFAGATYARVQVWKTSETLFTNVLKNHPNSELAWSNRGHYYRTSSDKVPPGPERENLLQRAMNDYNSAIEVNPKYHLAYSNRGKVWFERKQFDKAIEDYTMSIQLNGKIAKDYVNRGSSYAQTGRHELAMADFNAAIKLDPNYMEAYKNRGILHSVLKDYEMSMRDFENYLKYNPNDLGIRNYYGVCFFQLGLYQDALNIFSQNITTATASRDPELGTYYMNRSLAYNGMGNKAKALEDANKAKANGYTVPDNYFQMLMN
jgi:protein O-mannosyl-transferase